MNDYTTALNVLLAYGFSENCSKRALAAIDPSYSIEAALDWISEHRYDDDIDKPLPESQ
jgi:uncharacterized UBP type Zn finger protein